MTWWALFDKLEPVAAVGAAGVVAFFLGRAYERLDWLTGKRGKAPGVVVIPNRDGRRG